MSQKQKPKRVAIRGLKGKVSKKEAEGYGVWLGVWLGRGVLEQSSGFNPRNSQTSFGGASLSS